MSERLLAAGTPRRLAVGIPLACLVAVVACLALAAGSAQAIEIRAFSIVPTDTQAGGHPDITITYSGESHDNPEDESPCQCNDPKDIDFSLPTGFIGNPHATPQCKAGDFARNACAADSQVGVVAATVDAGGGLVLELRNVPVYNLVPRSNQAGLLGVTFLPGFLGVPLFTTLGARTGSDYGLNAYTEGLERSAVVQKFAYTLWGVPADESHTPLRPGCSEFCPPVKSNSPHIPFLINPSTCSQTVSSSVRVIGYDGSENTATDPWPANTGCDQLTFNPSLSARPTTTEADSASGVDIDLTVPQLLSPTFPSPSEIKATTVTLPVGFSINPNAADGKTSCTDAQASFGTTEEARCPEYSKVGTDVINSSALPEPIEGGIYLGVPLPGNRYRIFLTADGYATHIKLRGTIDADRRNGQLVAVFNELPQSPLTEINLHFFGAERGLLATPTQCGTYAVHSTFTPWDDVLPSQSSTQFFVLSSGPDGSACPGPKRPFAPSFSAASSGNTAGAHSPFAVNLERRDGDQDLTGLTVSTPPGFSATLAGVPYCPEAALAAAAGPARSGLAELAAPSCPAASQVGVATTGAGAGTHPIYLSGKVYLAGPYKGAPLSLAIVTPAVSGPYDLGDVVVRVALKVDPVTAHVTAISDPLPQIIEGIPLRLRTVRINLNRPNFTINPTNCRPFQVGATVLGDQGGVASLATHYQVANCAILNYHPSLSLRLTGGLRRLGHPAIHAVLRTKAGEANSRFVSVALPKGELLDNSHLGTVCTRVQFAAESCPSGSRLGNAVVISPLLEQPLKGQVYLRSSNQRLPNLAVKLVGQVDIETTAKIDSVNEGLRATFEHVPDVPFSTFRLNLAGGKRGLLQNSNSLCGANKRATVKMIGQNGARLHMKTKLRAVCHAKTRHRRHRLHRRQRQR